MSKKGNFSNLSKWEKVEIQGVSEITFFDDTAKISNSIDRK